MAIKLLLSGFENTGKSTVTSKIANAMVLNFDRKEYGFQVPHMNIKEYTGMDNLVSEINTKLGVYQEKMGKLPETVIFDTVTQFYTTMQKYNGRAFKGFDIHTNNNNDTLGLNGYIEDVLIANGINVVIVAHTVFDSETARHIIPASGQFAKAGSWMSVVNDAIFIEKKSGKFVIHQKSMKYPCRSTLDEIEEFVDGDSYDINRHIALLSASKVEATEYLL